MIPVAEVTNGAVSNDSHISNLGHNNSVGHSSNDLDVFSNNVDNDNDEDDVSSLNCPLDVKAVRFEASTTSELQTNECYSLRFEQYTLLDVAVLRILSQHHIITQLVNTKLG